MPRLADLVAELPGAVTVRPLNPSVRTVVYDSRRVRPGDIFVAVRGTREDGARYVHDAIARGAAAVVTEAHDMRVCPDVAHVVVPDARRALALLAAARWQHPSRRIELIGVTGTDGKTTTGTLVAEIYTAAGIPAGLMSTVELRVGGQRQRNPFKLTTPPPPEIQRTLARMVRVRDRCAVLEVSSHGAALDRVTGCAFDVAVLTNLSPEHLNFHGSMDAYRLAKERLYRMLDEPSAKPFRRFGVVNADDPHARHFADACPAPVVTYGIESAADVRASDIALYADRTCFRVDTPRGTQHVETRLLGRFNVCNWLAAIAVAFGRGLPPEAVERAAATFQPVMGRLQRVDAGQPFYVLVDYAHTPRALQAALTAARPLSNGRLILVLGHVGERYAGHRPRLGGAAIAGADLTILTTDDAFSEDPRAIIDQLLAGARAAGGVEGQNLRVIPDRRCAIHEALLLAAPGDVVVIAGRGHERMHVVGSKRTPFDDAAVAGRLLRQMRHRPPPSTGGAAEGADAAGGPAPRERGERGRGADRVDVPKQDAVR